MEAEALSKEHTFTTNRSLFLSLSPSLSSLQHPSHPPPQTQALQDIMPRQGKILHSKLLPEADQLSKLQGFYSGEGVAKKSRTSYKTYIGQYQTICDHYHVQAWPPTIASLSTFFTAKAHQGYTSSSLKQAKAGLKYETTRRAMQWLTDSQLLPISAIIKGAARLNNGATRRVSAMTNDLMRPLIKMMDASNQAHMVFATMWTVAHDALLRHDELCNLRVEDVEWHDSQAILTIRDPKTGKGRSQTAKLDNNHPMSGYAMLRTMCQKGRVNNKADKGRNLFPRIQEAGTGYTVTKSTTPTSPALYVRFLRQRLHLAGVTSAADFTPHSFRAGGATDLHKQGATGEEIKDRGRWRTATYRVYIRPMPTEEIQCARKALADKGKPICRKG